MEAITHDNAYVHTHLNSTNRPPVPPSVLSAEPAADEDVIHVLYHAPCKDGFTAAWAIKESFRLNPPKRKTKVHFTPESHGRYSATQKLLSRPSIGREKVIYLDICPPRDMLIDLFEHAKDLKVFDHHQTAEDNCGDLPYVFIDKTRSGAGIAWDHFCRTPRPFLIDIVEDGDLWRWKIPDSAKYLIVLETFRFTFDEWDRFNKWLTEHPEEVLAKGESYHEYREIVCRMLLGRKIHKLKLKGHTLTATNASIFQSGLGHSLCETSPCGAGAVYYTSGKDWKFSLRSTDKGIDVAKLAEQYGGGGHRNAAGFKVESLEDLKEPVGTFESDGYFEAYTEEEITEILSKLKFETADLLGYYFDHPFEITLDV